MFFKTGLLLTVFLAAPGCGTGQFLGPTMTAVPTDTPTPTATSSPTPTHTPTTAPSATARPTQVPDNIIFSDSFDDNSNHWELGDLMKIEEGLMHVATENHELAAIKIPLESTPNNVMVQVDIIPNPPAGSDPSTFMYGAGCRLNQTGDFYFFGVSPAPGVDGFFMANFLQFKEAKLVDYQFFPVSLSKAQNGDGFTATFRCFEDNFMILDGKIVVGEVTNSDFREGDLFLGLYQLDGIAGSVSFDNLTVSELH